MLLFLFSNTRLWRKPCKTGILQVILKDPDWPCRQEIYSLLCRLLCFINPTFYSIGVAQCILNVVQTVRIDCYWIESDEVRIKYGTETALWSKCFFFFDILG